jgi:hypothetical protein
MAYGAAAVAVIGTGFQIYANNKEAKAKSAAARASADAANKQAIDLLERYRINAEFLKVEGRAFIGDQIAASAELGRGDAPLLLLEETNMKVQKQLDIEEMEAESKAAAIRSGAQVDLQLAGDIRRANRTRNVGTFLSGVSSIAGGSN